MIRTWIAATAAVAFAFAAFAVEKPADKDSSLLGAAKPFVYAPKDSDVVIGKDDAPVTIVEYASLSCPHCAHFFTEALPVITKNYIDTGKAKLVYRDFPLNDPALKAAQLVQCADKDRRHAFIKVLFTTQNKWAFDANWREALAGIAALGGVDRSDFEACLKDKAIEKKITTVAKEAQDNYRVNSTPTFFVNNTLEPLHDAPGMSKAIDAALLAKK